MENINMHHPDLALKEVSQTMWMCVSVERTRTLANPCWLSQVEGLFFMAKGCSSYTHHIFISLTRIMSNIEYPV